MKLNSFLIGTFTSIFSVSAAYSAETVVAPEPEAVQYVRVCDAYGAGFFYIPGTETCMRISGNVRYISQFGDDVYGRGFTDKDKKPVLQLSNKRDTWDNSSRLALRASTATETELGTLKSFAETRFQWGNGEDSASSGSLYYGLIDLNGLRVGLDASQFVMFVGGLGNVFNDDVIATGGSRTALISYTYAGTNGWSAVLSLEQGNDKDTDNKYGYGGTIKDYAPHVVGGLKYSQAWGDVIAVAAYDARNEEWAGKLRGNLNITDQFSVWAMGGYKTNKDTYIDVKDDSGQVAGQVRAITSFYGQWGGAWAAWGGASFKATPKATFNAEIAYDETDTFYTTANFDYEITSGLTITPEISFVRWRDNKSVLNGAHALQGMVKVVRTF
jgi:hypothetical protein